jgi:hypothetical protein
VQPGDHLFPQRGPVVRGPQILLESFEGGAQSVQPLRDRIMRGRYRSFLASQFRPGIVFYGAIAMFVIRLIIALVA